MTDFETTDFCRTTYADGGGTESLCSATKPFSKTIKQLLHQYLKILTLCNIKGELANSFSLNINYIKNFQTYATSFPLFARDSSDTIKENFFKSFLSKEIVVNRIYVCSAFYNIFSWLLNKFSTKGILST